jgi:hypothetical protein
MITIHSFDDKFYAWRNLPGRTRVNTSMGPADVPRAELVGEYDALEAAFAAHPGALLGKVIEDGSPLLFTVALAVAAVVAHLGETGSCRVAPNGDVYGRAEENSREMRLGAVDPGDVERLREELKEAFSMHTAR